nr:MAPEG family protein [Shewanella electrodiphila]
MPISGALGIQGGLVPITIFYASFLALFYIYLSLRIIGIRKEVRASIGDGGSNELNRAIRVHANFSEYVPLTLLLLYFLETHNANAIVVHFLAALLLIARVVHAYGVSQTEENLKFRVFGMFSTICVIAVSSIYLMLLGAGIA